MIAAIIARSGVFVYRRRWEVVQGLRMCWGCIFSCSYSTQFGDDICLLIVLHRSGVLSNTTALAYLRRSFLPI